MFAAGLFCGCELFTTAPDEGRDCNYEGPRSGEAREDRPDAAEALDLEWLAAPKKRTAARYEAVRSKVKLGATAYVDLKMCASLCAFPESLRIFRESSKLSPRRS